MFVAVRFKIASISVGRTDVYRSYGTPKLCSNFNYKLVPGGIYIKFSNKNRDDKEKG